MVSLGLYFAALLLLGGFLASRRVSAELSERSLALGRRLDAFQELSGRVTQLSWNGQELAVSTLVAEQPVEDTLARFVALCDASAGTLADELATNSGLGRAAASVFKRMLVLRDLFDDGTGSAVCFAGLGEGGLQGLIARARRFTQSWDLCELGQLRYTFVRKVGPSRTHVILVSADGPLRLEKLVPLDGGDAEGEDAVAGARPAESVRMLTARARGTPHVFSAYRSRLSAPAALADYGRQLVAKGYERRAAPSYALERLPDGDPSHVLSEAYQRGDELYVVASQPDESGSMLSVVQLAERAIPSPVSGADVGRQLVGRGTLGGSRDRAFE
jgi:hypothetical protein